MLILWDDEYYSFDEDTEEEMAHPYKSGVVTPDCCEEVQRCMSITLAYEWHDLSDAPAISRQAPEGLSHAYIEGEDHSEYQRWLDAQPEEARKITVFEAAIPRWTMGLPHEKILDRYGPGEAEKYLHPPKYCPHCGKPLPGIERIPPEEIPGSIHRPIHDGDYCGTCGERSRSCHCLPPAAAWRVKGPSDRDIISAYRYIWLANDDVPETWDYGTATHFQIESGLRWWCTHGNYYAYPEYDEQGHLIEVTVHASGEALWKRAVSGFCKAPDTDTVRNEWVKKGNTL